jgi:hypothetical protein
MLNELRGIKEDALAIYLAVHKNEFSTNAEKAIATRDYFAVISKVEDATDELTD